MANPAPFPATAYDLPDWTRGVVQLTASGSGATIPVPAGNVVTGNHKQSYYQFVNGTTLTNTLLPNDGLQHYLCSCSMSVAIIAGTISGTVVATSTLQDTGGTAAGIATCTVYCNGLPTNGVMPTAITELDFAGGIAINVRPDLTNQLQWQFSVTGVNGGTITGSPRLESYLTISWT